MLIHLIASEEIMAQYAKVFKLKIDTPPDGLIHMVQNNVYTVAVLSGAKISEENLKINIPMPPGYKVNVYSSSIIKNTEGCPWSLRQTLHNNGYVDADFLKAANEVSDSGKKVLAGCVGSSVIKQNEITKAIITHPSCIQAITEYLWEKFDKTSIHVEYEPTLRDIREKYLKEEKQATSQHDRNVLSRQFQLNYEWMF